MDRIFVLRKGKIVEKGTHEELLTRQGESSALWHKQSGFEYKDQNFHITADRLQGLPLLSDLDATFLEKISNRFTTEIFETGDYFGEISLLSNIPIIATIAITKMSIR